MESCLDLDSADEERGEDGVSSQFEEFKHNQIDTENRDEKHDEYFQQYFSYARFY